MAAAALPPWRAPRHGCRLRGEASRVSRRDAALPLSSSFTAHCIVLLRRSGLQSEPRAVVHTSLLRISPVPWAAHQTDRAALAECRQQYVAGSSQWLVLSGHGSRRVVVCSAANDDSKAKQTSLDLEMEVFEFMKRSGKPDVFPSKDELLRAGRTELVEGILKQGGWLAIGWEKESPAQRKQSSSFERAPDYRDDNVDDSWFGWKASSSEKLRRSGDEGKSRTFSLANVLGFDPWKALQSTISPSQDAVVEEKSGSSLSDSVGRTDRSIDTWKARQDSTSPSNDPVVEEKSGSSLSDSAWQTDRSKRAERRAEILEQIRRRREGGRAEGSSASEGAADADDATSPRKRYKPKGYWANDENLKRELEEFNTIAGHPSMLPTSQELREARRIDLDAAVKRRGGWKIVAQLFGISDQQVQGSPRQEREYRFQRSVPTQETEPNVQSVPPMFDWTGVTGPSLPSGRRQDAAPSARTDDFSQNLGGQTLGIKPRQDLSAVDGDDMGKPRSRRRRRRRKQNRPVTEDELASQSAPLAQEALGSSREEYSSGIPNRAADEKPALGGLSMLKRIRALEMSLSATRAALQSGREALINSEEDARQVRVDTVKELIEVTDSLEFRESEIMRTRQELRNTRAEVMALEGKLAAGIRETEVEEESGMEMRPYLSVRPVRVVWPNPGTDVLLTGSFDNWTNQIKMEKSNAGVFVTTLQLQPGNYEIKFIVDGTWQIDPHRRIVYSHGNENNLLTVF